MEAKQTGLSSGPGESDRISGRGPRLQRWSVDVPNDEVQGPMGGYSNPNLRTLRDVGR